MLSALGFRTVFEFLLVALVIWAVFNENKLIAFERRIAASVRRRRLRVVKSSPALHTDRIYTR